MASSRQYFWKVRVWDKDGKASQYSAVSTWTMGLLFEREWKAKWIGAVDKSVTGVPAGRNYNISNITPGDKAKWENISPMADAGILLRKEVPLDKEVVRAVAYICGLGQYEFYVNGSRIGDYVLDPGWTDYQKRCLYTAYEVTENVKKGVNAFGVMLGNGMYNVIGRRYYKFKGSFGPPKVILQVELEFADGSSTRIVTDSSWRWSLSPVTYNCIFGGEGYNSGLEQTGWDNAGFDESAWQQAKIVQGPGGKLTSVAAPPIKVIKVLRPTNVTEPAPGVYVYDLGQNFSGWPKIAVKGPAGAGVKIVPGELLDEQGMVTQKGSGGPCFFTYTLRGNGTELWHPRFMYYGFRYVQVEGGTRDSNEAQAGKPLIVDVEGDFTHCSAEAVGRFSCSNELFNQIHKLIKMAVRSNLQSVLTDCPHREKIGWLEVSHLMGPAIMFNYDVQSFYRKIINDMRDAQLQNGLVPNIAPDYMFSSGTFREAVTWGSASVISPWYVYQRYGDRKLLADHYDMMKRYVDYLTANRAQEHIVSQCLGDWCDYNEEGAYGWPRNTPVPLVATAIYYYDITILEKIAALLGKTRDAERYSDLACDVRSAFNKEFFHADANCYATGSQTSNAMPLVLGLVPEDRADAVLENLIADVRVHNNHLTVGEVGLRFLLLALANGKRSDVIFDMASRTDPPSYGFQVKQGATALTEMWDPRTGFSQNHCMMGHIEEWFFQGLGGIGFDPAVPAYKKIIIKPQVVGDITWVETSYKSVHGQIVSNWQRSDGRLVMNVSIPANTTATVYVPTCRADAVTESGQHSDRSPHVRFLRIEDGAAVFETGSGKYRFASRISMTL